MNVIENDRQLGVLGEYAKLKLQLAKTLRVLLHSAEPRKDEMAIGECRRILARLAEDRFNLAIIGQFSRGKSSLMNALLGAEKLPTGVLPLTSVITTVAYGESERVLLQREGWALPQEIGFDQISEYVTQHGNPVNQKRVTLAEIQLPHELLRLGVHFIDTPGIASAVRANTRTTRQFLPEIDAAILVTSFESPFAETERDFLKEVREHVRTVFIVVNKHDLVAARERAQVLNAIREDLKAAFGVQFDVFAVSARDALLAKQRASPADLDASGLPALEAALTTFLRTQKACELLLRAADRTESVARQQEIAIRISERARAPEDVEAFDRRLQEILARIDDHRQVLIQGLRNRLRLKFPRRCQERIPLWNADSGASVTSQWREWFLREGDIAGKAFQDFLENLSQKLLSAWLEHNRPELERIFADLAQEESTPLTDLIDEICRVPAKVLADEFSLDDLLAPPIENPPLNLREIDLPLEGFQLPWWYDLLPNGWPRKAAYRRWQTRIPEFVQLYLRSVEAVLRTAIDDWAAGTDRQLTARIESARSQIVTLIHEKGDPPRSSEIGDILQRIQGFREAVWQIGEGHESEKPMLSAAMNPHARRSVLERCSICSRLERTLWDFMARAQYELSVSEARQQQHASRSGFCPLHTWQYETVSSPQGVCAAYPAVLTRFADRLRSLAHDDASVKSIDNGLRSMLPSQSSCEVCDLLASDERAASEQLARKISARDPECPALCSQHLRTVLAANPEVDAAKRLLLGEAQAFDDLAEEMQNYVLKHEAVRHHLTTRTEGQAAMAGLSRLVGSQRIASPWRID